MKNLLAQCLSDSLKCEPMSEEDFHKAGFQGSLPILTAKPPHHHWFVKHPNLSAAALVLFLFMIGFIKGLFGLAGVCKIGDFGLEQYLYQPKKIKGYQQPDLKKVEVMYDEEGYPVHPDTKERVRVISEERLFFLNCLFFFFWPCKKCCECKKKAKKDVEDAETDVTSDSEKSDTPKKKRGFFGRGRSQPSEDEPPKESPPRKGFFGRQPSEDKPPDESKEGPPKERKGFFGRRPAKPSEDPEEDKPPKEDKPSKPSKQEKPPKAKKGFFGQSRAKPPEDQPSKEEPSGKDKKAKQSAKSVPQKEGVSEKAKDKMGKKHSGESAPKEGLPGETQDEKGDKQQDEKTEVQPPADETSTADTKGPPTATRLVRPSLSDSALDTREVSTGPAADPLNKELERWVKGTERIKAVTK